jgi:hypothetical protein
MTRTLCPVSLSGRKTPTIGFGARISVDLTDVVALCAARAIRSDSATIAPDSSSSAARSARAAVGDRGLDVGAISGTWPSPVMSPPA